MTEGHVLEGLAALARKFLVEHFLTRQHTSHATLQTDPPPPFPVAADRPLLWRMIVLSNSTELGVGLPLILKSIMSVELCM